MGKIKRKWELLSEEERKEAIDEIIYFFKSEREEEMGIIAAEAILDFFQHTVGKRFYNKGVEDSIDFIRERMDDVQIDMSSLLKDR